ncbi:MAG TPA: hypothetical protein VKV22_11265 [Rhodanobacteraceae bacterium]|nr:hypothetical protein [Rhodanobacteraceae bacterium]
MNGFFWTSGHLGWGIFAAAVFTGLWILLADIYWRLRRTRMVRLLVMVASSWLVGIGLIVLCFFISN